MILLKKFPEKHMFFSICTLLLFTWGCSSYEKFQEIRMIMGTYVEVQVWCKDEKKANTGIQDAFKAMENVDETMSDYRDDSIISQLNRGGKGVFHVKDRDTFHVIQEATRISRLSHGAFDITIGPLMYLWFKNKQNNSIPGRETIEKVLGSIGYFHYQLNENTQEISFDQEGIQLDLGAIAKGFAVDKAISMLKKHGLTKIMVNAGGDLYVFDPPPGKSDWNIGLLDPFNKKKSLLTIPVTRSAIATSGNYEKFFTVGNKKFCHIIDPRTGYPVDGIVSVTVIAKNAMLSDALATTFFIMGYPEGLNKAESMENVESIMVACNGNNINVYFTSGVEVLKRKLKSFTISVEDINSVCHD